MPKGFDDFKYLLVVTCKLTRFVLALPVKSRAVQITAEAVIHRVIFLFGPPHLLIVHKIQYLQERSFSSFFQSLIVI